MDILYYSTCPVCGKEQQVKYPRHYKITSGRCAGLCSDCRKKLNRPADINDDFFITCPVCGEERQVTRRSYKTFKNGKTSGKCRSCGRNATIQKQLARRTEKITDPECCGCVLTVASRKRINDVSDSTRCEKFETCRHSSDCLRVLFKLNWDGFTADCRGFEVEDYKEPLDQIKLSISNHILISY